MGNFMLKYKKLILAFFLGGMIFGKIPEVAAYVINAGVTKYDNSSSGLNSTTTSDALDELYEISNSNNFFIKNYEYKSGKPMYYSTKENLKPTSSFPTTPPANQSIYFGLYNNGQYGLCIKKNAEEHCFRNDSWIGESKHILDVFGSNNCISSIDINNGSNIRCNYDDFTITINSDGSLNYANSKTAVYCLLDKDHTITCENN